VETNSIGSIHQNRVKYSHLFDEKKRDEITIETFYRLLMAEMSNQDPLEPMSNTEFISQMAAFTSLQVQQEALHYNNSNYAQSMIGKNVIVARSTGAGLDVKSGPVERVNFTGGEFKVTVEGEEFPLKNIMEVLDSTFGLPNGQDGAFATSLIGKYVTIGLVNSVGVPVIAEGIVERVEIKDGNISIIIDDLAYPLHSVAKVEPPDVVERKNASAPGGTTA
jgi:flagellar basal-body rod modification protein FlgD